MVQQTRKLSYNSQLKLTVAKYYIPSGRCIQALDYSNRNKDGSVGKISDSLMTEFQTRNGRKVFDGGGIKPDILTTSEKFGSIIMSLSKERLFFDYATEFRFEHESIPEEFIFSDENFDHFTSYISNKEYTYKTKTEKALENLKNKATDEHYFDNVSNEYNALSEKLTFSKRDDLLKSKEDIMEILSGEIMSRYFYQKGRIKSALTFDTEVENAIAILTNKDEYNNILEIE